MRFLSMTVVVVVNFYNSSIKIFKEDYIMQITKEIISIFSEKEHVADLLFTILSTDNSYTEKLHRIAEDIAKQAEVTANE